MMLAILRTLLPRAARQSVALAPLLAVLMLTATAAEAQTARHYRDGKAAAEAGRWSDVKKSMTAAIAEDPEARRKTFSRYTPYYFLGVARAELGDCRGALEAWQLTDRYGALREGGEEAQDLKKRRQRCSKLISDVKKITETARDSIEEAGESADRLDRLSSQEFLASIWDDGPNSLASQASAAAGLLGEARANVERGDRELNLDLLAEAGYQAAEAIRAFDAALQDAESRLSAANQAVSSAMSELDDAEKKARRLLRSVRSVAPYPERLGRQVAKLRRVIARSDQEQANASTAELAALTAELEKETQALRPLATKPPAALKDAATAFLANDFQGVIDVLSEQDFRPERARFHAGLLQSAALFGLYVESGESDEEVLERCREAIRGLSEMDQTLGRPGERFFSPRFRGFFDRTLQELAEEALAAEAGDGSEDPAPLEDQSLAPDGAAGGV